MLIELLGAVCIAAFAGAVVFLIFIGVQGFIARDRLRKSEDDFATESLRERQRQLMERVMARNKSPFAPTKKSPKKVGGK